MPKKLHIEFVGINKQNIDELRKLNAASFPVNYNDSFYHEIVKRNDMRLNKFAVFKGTIVGAICTRLEYTENTKEESGSNKKRPGNQRLYIMTLAVMAVYRGRGIGSQLLKSILEFCDQENASTNNISEIALHVQITNQDAINFYTERFDFVQGEMVKNYYRRINPPHCYLLYKRLDQEPEKLEATPAKNTPSDAISSALDETNSADQE